MLCVSFSEFPGGGIWHSHVMTLQSLKVLSVTLPHSEVTMYLAIGGYNLGLRECLAPHSLVYHNDYCLK